MVNLIRQQIHFTTEENAQFNSYMPPINFVKTTNDSFETKIISTFSLLINDSLELEKKVLKSFNSLIPVPSNLKKNATINEAINYSFDYLEWWYMYGERIQEIYLQNKNEPNDKFSLAVKQFIEKINQKHFFYSNNIFKKVSYSLTKTQAKTIVQVIKDNVKKNNEIDSIIEILNTNEQTSLLFNDLIDKDAIKKIIQDGLNSGNKGGFYSQVAFYDKIKDFKVSGKSTILNTIGANIIKKSGNNLTIELTNNDKRKDNINSLEDFRQGEQIKKIGEIIGNQYCLELKEKIQTNPSIFDYDKVTTKIKEIIISDYDSFWKAERRKTNFKIFLKDIEENMKNLNFSDFIKQETENYIYNKMSYVSTAKGFFAEAIFPAICAQCGINIANLGQNLSPYSKYSVLPQEKHVDAQFDNVENNGKKAGIQIKQYSYWGTYFYGKEEQGSFNIFQYDIARYLSQGDVNHPDWNLIFTLRAYSLLAKHTDKDILFLSSVLLPYLGNMLRFTDVGTDEIGCFYVVNFKLFPSSLGFVLQLYHILRNYQKIKEKTPFDFSKFFETNGSDLNIVDFSKYKSEDYKNILKKFVYYSFSEKTTNARGIGENGKKGAVSAIPNILKTQRILYTKGISFYITNNLSEQIYQDLLRLLSM